MIGPPVRVEHLPAAVGDPGVVDREVRVVVGEQHRVDHRQVDVLADTGPLGVLEGGHHPDHAVQPGERVANRQGDVARLVGAVEELLAGEQPGLGVDDRGIGRPIALRALLAEARDREHDQSGVHCRERLPAEPEARHHARPVVLEDHVGLRCQLQDQLATFRATEVDADRALAHVLLGEIARQVVDLAADHAGHVTLGWFDLDDVGAEIAQHAADEGPCEHAGEIEHLDAVE